MRYRIKARLADLNMTSVELVDMMKKDGWSLYTQEFSSYITGRRQTPKADKVCEYADKLLTRLELEKKIEIYNSTH